MELRQQIIAEIMKLVQPEPKPLEKPTIAELEKILNSETTDAVNINPDGSIGVRPTTTTVGAVADAVVRIIEAERAKILAALKELHALVWGECPSLLDEDSGGSAELDLDIKELISATEARSLSSTK